ncbi:DEAD/DEAH box helicase [Achromobacter xylosoxidans]|uniref:DEAD/DEAH box helicase n=3 Tax=Bacteria TaxID=2 RepID=UPI0006C18D72|nr:DEAD/DEAH box helicase [Achromobacter xylosoxidans]CUI84302.1 ATP-dependent helicase HepA [Achromobacter xylosoxidans]CUJ97489.1 ATP-dependent helicase HepA [Achromobacter xylosoxidans]CUR66140.1 ATP-dependent helicase HepA [Achromobacter xylosoxidans]
MNQAFAGWQEVAERLKVAAEAGMGSARLNEGQCASLLSIARRLPKNGVLIGDEVGMGKTRIATEVVRAVAASGGRVAIVVPPGLPFQWKAELMEAKIEDTPILRSLRQFILGWDSDPGTKPWFEQHVVVVSHAFANWRLGARSEAWRWGLLPELYAQWYLRRSGKLPYGYRTRKDFDEPMLHVAASSIADAAEASTGEMARSVLDELFDTTPWPQALEAGAYVSTESLRPKLERAVGLGLGVFDLVIVDEAHKSRAKRSVLSTVLDRVLVRADGARTLALTATPVELGVHDWKSSLGRVGVQSDDINACIDVYSKAVKAVRETPSDPAARTAYKSAARAFQKGLAQYLIRRDKSEDLHVRRFRDYTKNPHHDYRHEADIMIETKSLSLPWRRAVCAAEALSVVSAMPASYQAKRLRLTIGNGHGIAAMLRDRVTDDPDGSEDLVASVVSENEVEVTEAVRKREERAAWWSGVLGAAFSGGGNSLYDHPAIRAAVTEIEAVCERNEKVLVFGRYTAPLRALTELLNARAMLRSLREGVPWPQSTLSDSEWAATLVAHEQLGFTGAADRDTIASALKDQYKAIENKRRSFRAQLLVLLEKGLAAHPSHALAQKLFGVFRRTVIATESDDEVSPLALVARTLQELLSSPGMAQQPTEVADAFIGLIEASVDRGEHDDGDTGPDDSDAKALWLRIVGELNSPHGGFARLMNGDTSPRTRRLLQLAFNRERSSPRVLVAQSMVGREGLNLHRACKTVVLLHPEWNPGVVEQQIGRVDRIGSLWQKSLDQAIDMGAAPSEMPFISVRPVVFKGTYDEWNWAVLRERWDDLRAQLQGIVISSRLARDAAIPADVVEEINRAAPRFSGRDDQV